MKSCGSNLNLTQNPSDGTLKESGQEKIYGRREAVMGYIMDLRAFVGHRPLIQVGSSVILED